MFPVFHLAWSSWPATKTFVAVLRKLLRKVEPGSTLNNKFWFCCSFFIKLTTCRATNLLVPINQSARCIPSTRNGSSWSRQVKNGEHQPKLATKQCCATSWGFFVSRISPPLGREAAERATKSREVYTNGSNNVIRLNMQWQLSVLNGNTKN